MKTAMRYQHVDIAKALCVILVVLGHSVIMSRHAELDSVLRSFRMPLFFFLAGIFFPWRRTFTQLAWSKADALLKPALVFFLLLLAARVMWKGWDPALLVAGFLGDAGKIAGGSPLWFLPHLWLLFVFSHVFIRLTDIGNRAGPVVWAPLPLMLIAGIFLMRSLQPWSHAMFPVLSAGLPFGLDMLLLTASFFLAGFLLRQPVIDFRPEPVIVFSALVFFVVMHVFSSFNMDLYSRRYDHVIFSSLNAMAGIFLMLALSRWLEQSERVSGFLSWLGAMSIFILLFHEIIQRGSLKVINSFYPPHPFSEWIAFFMGVLLPLLIGSFIKKSHFLSPFFLPRASDSQGQEAYVLSEKNAG